MNEQRPYHAGPSQPAFAPVPPPPWPPYPGHRGPLHGAPTSGQGAPAPSYAWVWGLVGSLVLMAAVVLGGGAWVLASGPETYGDDPHLDSLWDACERGNLGACDRLYDQSPLFSEYEELGFTCGGRTLGEVECAP